MYGVGPVYVAVILLLTRLGIGMTCAGRIPIARYGLFRIPLAIVGIALILLGAWMWYSAVFRAKVDEHITGNTLAATGVYAWVRNPIYSSFLLACTGALLLANNLWLLILPVVFWLYLTVLMKCTEETQLRTNIPGSASRRPLFDRQRIHRNRYGGREIFENNQRDAALHAGAIKGAAGEGRLCGGQAASSLR